MTRNFYRSYQALESAFPTSYLFSGKAVLKMNLLGKGLAKEFIQIEASGEISLDLVLRRSNENPVYGNLVELLGCTG